MIKVKVRINLKCIKCDEELNKTIEPQDISQYLDDIVDGFIKDEQWTFTEDQQEVICYECGLEVSE